MTARPRVSVPCGVVSYLRERNIQVAGALLLVAGTVALMGIITAETLYPGYSTSDNMISDLGATEPPDSIIEQPSSNLFSGTMIVTGALVMIGTYFARMTIKENGFTVPLTLFGLGVLGVGVFNGSWGDVHGLFALTAFVAGALAAIMSYKVFSAPMRHISVVLGLISLITIIQYFALDDSSPLLEMGEGGVERWIAYPTLMWTTAAGGFLMAREGKGG